MDLDGHRPVRAFALAFSPDRTILASAQNEGTIKLWDLSDGHLIRTLVQPSGVWSLAFNRLGTSLAAGGHGVIQVWDVSAGKLKRTLEIKGTTMSLAFDSADRWLAATSNDVLHVWSLKDLQKLELKGHTFMICSVAFSPDGGLIASGGGLLDNSVRLWRPAKGSAQMLLGAQPHRVEALAFSPDGEILASASVNGTLKLWRVFSGSLLRTLETEDYIGALTFSAEGRKLIAATRPNRDNQSKVRVWEAHSGIEIPQPR